MMRANAAMLPDGRRLHLQHGPIDLVIEAFGDRAEVRHAYRQATDRFGSVLDELVAELPLLRQPSQASGLRAFRGPTARRMEAATHRLCDRFVTPMAAVAGAVADEVLAALLAGRRLDRAYVNDGGDIALHLAPGQRMRAAIAGTGHGFADRIAVSHEDPVRGIATSGWRGRSHSLGIADAVTVLAASAAGADAAATLIANCVDLPGHPSIGRKPARELTPDSDLGDRPVTVSVGRLDIAEVELALDRGLAVAHELLDRGLIAAAALFLGGVSRQVGMPAHAYALVGAEGSPGRAETSWRRAANA